MLTDPIWTGDNLEEIRAAFRAQFGDCPRDWIEEMPDGDLMIMADTLVMVERGRRPLAIVLASNAGAAN